MTTRTLFQCKIFGKISFIVPPCFNTIQGIAFLFVALYFALSNVWAQTQDDTTWTENKTVSTDTNHTGTIQVGSSSSVTVTVNSGAVLTQNGAITIDNQQLSFDSAAGTTQIMGAISETGTGTLNAKNGNISIGTDTTANANAVGITYFNIGNASGDNSTVAYYGGDSGRMTVSSAVTVGDQGSGAFSMNSGTLQTSKMYIGNSANSTGVVTISGGTVSLSIANDVIYVGKSGNGTLNVSGGTVSSDFLQIATDEVAGSVATGAVNISSGEFTVLHNIYFQETGANEGSSGSLTVSGGKLTLGGNVTKSNVNGTATVNLNGGTVFITDTDSTSLSTSYQWDATVGVTVGGNATIQTDSNNTTTIKGTISGNSTEATLTKSGAGTLVLSGANTFKGNTTITGGTLKLTGDSSLSEGTILTGTNDGAGTLEFAKSYTQSRNN